MTSCSSSHAQGGLHRVDTKLGHIASPLYGDWLSSDRPPLQTGLYLALAIQTGMIGYQIVSSWLQATFLFGVWAVAAAAGLPTAARRLVLLACCLLPTTIINTFYTWPKLIAVCNLLLVFALLFSYRPNGDRERRIIGLMLGGLAAFAVLAHGSSVFALIGMALVVLVAWQWPAWKTIIYAVPTLVGLYASWMAYQLFIDPPGNRLPKWHLAGISAVDPRSLLTSMRDSYGALTWPDYLHGRIANLKVLAATWPHNLRDLASVPFNPSLEVLYNIRLSDFFISCRLCTLSLSR
jgi:hypothetical protein